MKKGKLFLGILLATMLGSLQAQTVIDFEELNLPADTFWNGSDLSGGFQSKGVYFVNYYDTSWDVWSGFAYSNKTDTVTAGYTNQYSTAAGQGAEGSQIFALAYVSPYSPNYIKLTGYEGGSIIEGFYITNNTYAYISMRDGDAYSKKFGGDDGNDPDWFKLTVNGYYNGNETGTAEFYLADYRFADNDSDYIVKDWRWFDLTSLGTVDSVTFSLSSSDTGEYGMNTPAYFCMDNLTLSENFNGTVEINFSALNVYPNPVVNYLYASYRFDKAQVYTTNGVLVKTITNDNKIDFSNLKNGIYILKLEKSGKLSNFKILKK
jgi:hypothetical protein